MKIPTTTAALVDILPPRLRLYGCPLPNDDETLSSWITRVSHHYLLPRKAILDYCFGSGIDALMSVDPDVTILEGIQASLASKMGVEKERFSSLTALTPRVLGWPTESWLVANLGYTKYQSSFCPQCLATDETPYFRNKWRQTSYKTCSVHNCVLVTSCPHCHFSVFPFRHGTAKHIGARILEQCPYCIKVLHECPTEDDVLVIKPSLPTIQSTSTPLVLRSPSKRLCKKLTAPRKVKSLKKFHEFLSTQNVKMTLDKTTEATLYAEWSRDMRIRFLRYEQDPARRLLILGKGIHYLNSDPVTKWPNTLVLYGHHFEEHFTGQRCPEFDIPKYVASDLYAAKIVARREEIPWAILMLAKRLEQTLASLYYPETIRIITTAIDQCYSRASYFWSILR